MDFAIEQMNLALERMCKDTQVSDKDKLNATQNYIALYLRLENEKMREIEHREAMKLKKLTTRIKQVELDDIEGGGIDKKLAPINQSKFSPTMN